VKRTDRQATTSPEPPRKLRMVQKQTTSEDFEKFCIASGTPMCPPGAVSQGFDRAFSLTPKQERQRAKRERDLLSLDAQRLSTTER
jgi:hypothetical protein